MTITFLLFYYYPEKPTINHLFQPILDKLLKDGHKVNIITSNPVRGVAQSVQTEYQNKKYEVFENLHIYREQSYTYRPEKFSKLKLLRRYISVSLKLAKKLKQVPSDIVFVGSNPPLLLSYLTTRYCKRHQIKAVYNIQDIYPDNVFKKGSLPYLFFNHFQIQSLKRATKVITISETMKNTLLSKGDFVSKIVVAYNWDISKVHTSINEMPKILEENKFNIVYAGNIGYMQDLDVILKSAQILSNDPNIAFNIIGEGSQGARIKAKIKTMELPNTHFYDPLEVLESGGLYKYADINLISILPDVINTALPLKTASCLAAGKPLIFIGLDNKHQEEWVNQEGIYNVPNRDCNLLVKAIEEIYQAKHERVYTFNNAQFNEQNSIEKYLTALLTD